MDVFFISAAFCRKIDYNAAQSVAKEDELLSLPTLVGAAQERLSRLGSRNRVAFLAVGQGFSPAEPRGFEQWSGCPHLFRSDVV